jgi:hypothetical protein
LKLIDARSSRAEYLPVAMLLRNGHACAGYYNPSVNEDLEATCVLLNAHLIELQGSLASSGRPTINDFNELLEEIVVNFASEDGKSPPPHEGVYGKSIPLMAISYEEIAVVYPVAHIGVLMRRAEQQGRKLPTFLDLDKSEIINLLRTRLW